MCTKNWTERCVWVSSSKNSNFLIINSIIENFFKYLWIPRHIMFTHQILIFDIFTIDIEAPERKDPYLKKHIWMLWHFVIFCKQKRGKQKNFIKLYLTSRSFGRRLRRKSFDGMKMCRKIFCPSFKECDSWLASTLT